MLRLLFLSFFLLTTSVYAQSSGNYLFMEVGGSGLTGSANYAKSVFIHHRFKVIFQIGMGWTPNVAESTNSFDMPLQLTCNFGQQGFFLEAGIGASTIFKSKLGKQEGEDATNELYLSPVVGFRHESRNWFARVYACPLIHVTGEEMYDELTSQSLGFGVGIGAFF